MKKKLSAIVSSLIIAACLASCSDSSAAPGSSSQSQPQTSETSSQADPSSGKCGENAQWQLDDSGVLKITGSGEMSAMYAGSAPWYAVREKIKKAEIANGITSISAGAFSGCVNLEQAVIPDSVKTIGKSAFYNCGLKQIEIPNSVESLGECVFWDCGKLESAKIGSGVKALEYNAFCKCRKLKSISLSQGLERIGDCAFEYCDSLKSITIPDSVTSFGGNVFPTGETVISGSKGSAAETFANKYGYKFEAV